jgi:DNA-binding response OmpR family regulator
MSIDPAMIFSMSYGIEAFLVENENLPKVYSAARFLNANDSETSQRAVYLSKIFSNIVTRPFFDEETYTVSRAWGDYEILLIGGNDPLRMGRYLRANRFLLNPVAKIAVMHGSTPPRRARLLNAGFDDVIDSAKMAPTEAIARITAILQCYSAHRQKQHNRIERDASIATYCNPMDLTPREQALLWALAHKAGQSISVSQVAKLIDANDPVKLKRSIKVSISNLRRKLLGGYTIESDYQGGYGLYHRADQTMHA